MPPGPGPGRSSYLITKNGLAKEKRRSRRAGGGGELFVDVETFHRDLVIVGKEEGRFAQRVHIIFWGNMNRPDRRLRYTS